MDELGEETTPGKWQQAARENTSRWGYQNAGTLVLAMMEELGEVAHALRVNCEDATDDSPEAQTGRSLLYDIEELGLEVKYFLQDATEPDGTPVVPGERPAITGPVPDPDPVLEEVDDLMPLGIQLAEVLHLHNGVPNQSRDGDPDGDGGGGAAGVLPDGGTEDREREQTVLPETHPKYPEPVTDPICVACGKTMGTVGVCYRCRGRIRGAGEDEIEQELVKAYARGRASEYWDGECSLHTDSDQSALPDGGTTTSDRERLVLTDDGVRTPDRLVGRTGVVTVEKPNLTMEITFSGDVREVEPELLSFPPTGEDHRGFAIPEGHVRINGWLYEVVDERELNECPHCGSDKVAAHDDPPKCYGCDRMLDAGSERDVLPDGGTDPLHQQIVETVGLGHDDAPAKIEVVVETVADRSAYSEVDVEDAIEEGLLADGTLFEPRRGWVKVTMPWKHQDGEGEVEVRADGGVDVGPEHIYVVTLPWGERRWSTDYNGVFELATGRNLSEIDPETYEEQGESRISIMHKRGREYVLDLAEEHPTECSMNRGYDCGHAAYGPPRRLPEECPACHPSVTDGGVDELPDPVPPGECDHPAVTPGPGPDGGMVCIWCETTIDGEAELRADGGDGVPWEELEPAQQDNFALMLQDAGLDIGGVEDAEPYYGNKEKAVRDLREGGDGS